MFMMLFKSNRKYIKVSFSDNGVGVPQENLQSIFDPFFTTKQKGSGLGLATAYSIIKKHGGGITIDSEIGVGTTFNIYLPASQEEMVRKKLMDLISGLLRSKKRVVKVE